MTTPHTQPLARFSDALRGRFPNERETFDSYEDEIARWEGMFKQARGMAHHEERRLRETGQRTARRQIGHLAAATVVRVVDLADGLVLPPICSKTSLPIWPRGVPTGSMTFSAGSQLALTRASMSSDGPATLTRSESEA
jgi:4'-phosphopantetheinyl transferase EntD